jgi:AcrR family transcriptional regulator
VRQRRLIQRVIDNDSSVDQLGGAPRPLPRGRHKLSVETVRASQRERLLLAMLGEVTENGYEATTVGGVVTRARVSRNAFYALFADKLDCFVALSEMMREELLKDTFQPRTSDDWRSELHAGTLRYLRWWASHPRFARVWLIETPLAGPRAVEHREQAYAGFSQLLERLAAWARAVNPGTLAPLRPSASHVAVTGITELILREVQAGRVGELEQLAGEVDWIVERLLMEPASTS